MFKNMLHTLILTGVLLAGHAEAGCNCAVGKEFLRCAYYVEKQGDLTQQKACLTYASGLLEGESPGRASWYFIVGGDFDRAIAAARKAIDRGEYYAFESLGEAWLLKGDTQKAKAAFTELRKAVPGYKPLITKHFETLTRLYPQKWDSTKALTLLK